MIRTGTRGRRRPYRAWLAATAVVILGFGAVSAYALLQRPGNVSHPNLEFTDPSATSTPATTPVATADDFLWPRYGFDAGRTRYLPASTNLNPPLHRGWSYHGRALLEFPPVIHRTSLYFLDDDGLAVALDKRDGRLLWRRKVGTLAAASPAVGSGLVLMPVLSTRPHTGQNPGDGRFLALSERDGHVVWSRPVGPGSESSPLVWNDTVYFGDQSGAMHALRVQDGREQWTYHASGPVKGGPSLAGGLLYFGDYAGRAYAVDAATGHAAWAVSTSGSRLGLGSGNFYSTPAVAFGRVYMGSTDGRVYSFAAHSGRLAWATQTGAYVYSSPAVADIRGLGATVYIGSYDGTFYAFDARSGSKRWSHAANGRISGSPTVVGDVVYYSNLATKTTAGLDVRTGQTVFRFGQGAFSPVIADRQAIYLIGYGDLFQMLPRPKLGAAPANLQTGAAQ